MLFGAQIKEFPSQKKSFKEKDETWRKECIDASESLIFFQNSGIRQRRLQKKVNYDLYNGIVNKADMERICNPFGIKIDEFPAEPKNYPITNPYIQTLKGEEIKRRFDWKVMVINEDAISDKEEALKGKTIEYLKEVISKGLNGQEVADEEIEKRIKYLRYDYQDMREISATRILDYYTKYLDVKTTFSKGWEDFILVGEEIYAIDEVNNNPEIRKCNPLNTYFLTSPNSNYVEDSDIVTEEAYIPLGQVIDRYYDYLTADEIEMITRKQGPTATNDSTLGYANRPLTFLDTEVGASNYIDTDNVTFATIGGAYDNQGNVRVVRTVWRSMRKVGILTYFDQELGEVKETVSEEYRLSKEEKEAGAKIKWIWINEAWEGTKIAGHIYVKMEPRKIQFRESDNISKCSLGYVGTLYNTNSNRIMSIFDIMKQYQYTYNAYAYRLELANIKSYGRIGELDLAEVPDGWTEDMYLYYATIMGFRVKDSFKEARKGAATGKLVGTTTSPSSGVMDMEQRGMISQGLEMLRYFDEQLAAITGINRQRQGQISSSEGLGVTQEAKASSSTITESYFAAHDNTKLRVLRTLLETAKFCLKNGNKKIQNVLDDMTTAIYTIEGEQLNEADYGIIVGDATQDERTLQSLQRATEMAVQTGKVNLTQMMNVYANSSMSSIRRKIEEAEIQQAEQQQQQIKHEQEIAQQQQALAEQIHQEELNQRDLDRQLQQYIADANNATKIQVAEISVYSRQEDLDQNNNGIPDPLEIGKQALEQQKIQSDSQHKMLSEANKQMQANQKISLEKEKLASKEKLEQLKIKAVEVQNKNQIELANKKAKLDKELADKDRVIKEKEIKAKIQIAKSKSKTK
jgi:hypothetical protein